MISAPYAEQHENRRIVLSVGRKLATNRLLFIMIITDESRAVFRGIEASVI